MIQFFRRVRKQLLADNRFTKYFLYAIGEIVLVVIGILIALQVNNWNESRKARQKEKGHLMSIYQDLKNDLLKIGESNDHLANQYTMALEVLEALESRNSKKMDSARVAARLGWDLSEVIPVERDRNTWDELKVRGAESQLISDVLKTRLDRFYEGFDRQIDRYNQLPKKARQDLRELTGTCHNSKTVRSMYENGVRAYGASSPSLQHCILTNSNAHALTGTIAVSAIVHMAIYDELYTKAEALLTDMEAEFDFL